MDTKAILKDAYKIGMLIVLVLLLLGILTWTGILKPRVIPGWCNVYWGTVGFATGGPKVAIVYGDDGLGNPIGPCEEGRLQCSLKDILANPEILGVRADAIKLNNVNLGNLRNYHIVIVEKAKTMETRQMRALMDYYAQGGRLVWTGDSGTELGPNDQYLYANERTEGDANKIIGPWARKDKDIMVSLDELLSVEYETNYCKAKSCTANIPIHAGNLVPETTMSHPLIRGMSSSLQLYVFKDEDFAIVKTMAGNITTEALSLEYNGNLIGTDGKDYGKETPMIVTSGLGERAIYYAMPPEYYANAKLYPKYGPYFLPIENLYWGILCG